MKRVMVAMSGGVDSAVSAYILKKKGFAVEAVFMNNWSSSDECNDLQKTCTIDADLMSIEQTCKILNIAKVNHVNYQSSYWQRVFFPVLSGYQSGASTPNPDILCNREIKFGELLKWTIEEDKAEYLATGHYARIFGNELRQAVDLSKDQTYFLASVDRTNWRRVMFPVGSVMKSDVKSRIIAEAGLDHLKDRKESMGLCFVGKRNFKDFIDDFAALNSTPGPIFDLDTGKQFAQQHSGLASYTIGQSASLSGAPMKYFVARKDSPTNTIYVVPSKHHPELSKKSIKIDKNIQLPGSLMTLDTNLLYCSIRSSDKVGIKVKGFLDFDSHIEVELCDAVFAPCPGQWAVFYYNDEHSHTQGRVCVGGSQII